MFERLRHKLFPQLEHVLEGFRHKLFPQLSMFRWDFGDGFVGKIEDVKKEEANVERKFVKFE